MVCIAIVFVPPSAVNEMETVAEPGSALLTRPPTLRFCQSSRSCSCFASTSARFITMMPSAGTGWAVSEAFQRTNTRSPTCKSFNSTGTAVFKSVCPGATRTILVVGWTLTAALLPESVVIVTVVPSIDLMAPTCFSTALGEAACWFDRAPTEGAKKLPQAVSVEIAQMANSNLVFLNQSIQDTSLRAAHFTMFRRWQTREQLRRIKRISIRAWSPFLSDFSAQTLLLLRSGGVWLRDREGAAHQTCRGKLRCVPSASHSFD